MPSRILSYDVIAPQSRHRADVRCWRYTFRFGRSACALKCDSIELDRQRTAQTGVERLLDVDGSSKQLATDFEINSERSWDKNQAFKCRITFGNRSSFRAPCTGWIGDGSCNSVLVGRQRQRSERRLESIPLPLLAYR